MAIYKQKMADEEKWCVCVRIEEMDIAPAERHRCFRCRSWVGVTEASREHFESVSGLTKYICLNCFMSESEEHEFNVVPPSDGQRIEIIKNIRQRLDLSR